MAEAAVCLPVRVKIVRNSSINLLKNSKMKETWLLERNKSVKESRWKFKKLSNFIQHERTDFNYGKFYFYIFIRNYPERCSFSALIARKVVSCSFVRSALAGPILVKS